MQVIQSLSPWRFAHLYTGRDSNSQFLLLAVEMRKLRNILEDIEERTTADELMDPLSYEIYFQVVHCTTILYGIQVNFKSSSCSTFEFQDIPMETILAFKASIELSRESLSTAFHNYVRLRDFCKSNPNEASDLFSTCDSSPSASTNDEVEVSAGTTLEPGDGTKSIGTTGQDLAQSCDSLLYHDEHTTSRSLETDRMPRVSPAAPTGWQSPLHYLTR